MHCFQDGKATLLGSSLDQQMVVMLMGKNTLDTASWYILIPFLVLSKGIEQEANYESLRSNQTSRTRIQKIQSHQLAPGSAFIAQIIAPLDLF